MKRLMILACLSATILLLFSGCRHLPNTPVPDQQPAAQSTDESGSYADLPAIYGEGGKVFITLYENAAIPYRWVCMVSDTLVLRLVGEKVVDGADRFLAAGDSPSYHQFVLEWVSDGQATLTLENQRMPEYSDGEDEPAECRKFNVSRYGQEVFFEETTVESDR